MDQGWERGTCARCGRGEVLHHVLGMPLLEAVETAPPWVRWAGCTALGPDRECLRCGHTWWADDVGFAGDGGAENDDWAEDDGDEGAPAPLRVVGGVLVDGTGRVLAARRGPGREEAGRWEFPGGKIEPGESPQEALVRELREELAVEVEVGRHIARGTGRAGERELHLDCYWARLPGPAPTASTDHDRLRWCAPEELAALDWAAADLPVLAALREGAVPRGD
jgi:8-oxo-dGTP diphosphatase